MKSVYFLLLCAGGLLFVEMVYGQFEMPTAARTTLRGTPEYQRIVAPDATDLDFFGASVAIDGDIAVVGAPNANIVDVGFGSVYVFERNSTNEWIYSDTILGAASTNATDMFGSAVAIEGETIVVGAPQHDAASGGAEPLYDSGIAYVFERNPDSSWSETKALRPLGIAARERWGTAVAIDDSRIVVGGPGDGLFSFVTGRAAVFGKDGTDWVEETISLPTTLAANDSFGRSVAISNDSLLIGADRSDLQGNLSGSAYVFSRSGSSWALQQTLTAYDAASGDQFGSAVALDGDTAVVSAFRKDGLFTNTGKVYIYQRQNNLWSLADTLTATNPQEDDVFGFAVAIKNNEIAVSIPTETNPLVDPGSVSFFSFDGLEWNFEYRFVPEDGQPADNTGRSVAYDGSTFIVGARLADISVENQGAAYLIQGSNTEGCGIAADINDDGLVDTADLGLLISAFGSGDSSVDLNNDGIVDTADLGLLIAEFGAAC